MKRSDLKLFAIAFTFLVILGAIIYLLASRNETTEYTFDDGFQSENNYGANEVLFTYVDSDNLVGIYYYDFVNLMIFNSEEAYKMLDESSYEDYPTLASFEAKAEELFDNGILESSIKEYKVNDDDSDSKYYYVTDNAGNSLTFIEKTIMDYKVII